MHFHALEGIFTLEAVARGIGARPDMFASPILSLLQSDVDRVPTTTEELRPALVQMGRERPIFCRVPSQAIPKGKG